MRKFYAGKRLQKSLCLFMMTAVLGVGSMTVYGQTDVSGGEEATEVISGSAVSGEAVTGEALNQEWNVNNLPDGQYDIYAEMIKMDRENFSMANNGINHTVRLEVKDGEYYLTIQFKGLAIYNKFGYLMNLSYYDEGYTYNQIGIPKGDLVPAEVVSTYDVVDRYNDAEHLYPQLLKIKLVDKASEQYVPLQVFVPIMESITAGSGTQNVLMQIDWSTLQQTDEELKVEGQEEQSPELDVTDETTKVKLYAEKGVFKEGAALQVTKITEGEKYSMALATLSDVSEKFYLYEISVVDSEQKQLEPNGTVTICFPIPDESVETEMLLYRINDDGTKTLTKGTVESGYYTAVTKRFGVYVLAEKLDVSASDVNDSDNTNNQPNENISNNKQNRTGNMSNATNHNVNAPKTADLAKTEILVTLLVCATVAMVMTIIGRKYILNEEKKNETNNI